MAFDYTNYVELEYLSSDGTGQYIDTGIQINNYAVGLKLETKMTFNAIPNEMQLLFGTGYRSSSTNPTVLNYGVGYYSTTSSTNFMIMLGQTVSSSVFNSNVAIDLNNVSEIIHTKSAVSQNTYTIDGASITRNGNFSSSYLPLKIFCGTNAGSTGTRNAPRYFSNSRLEEYFRISQNDNLIAEFIPARRISDDELGLYETVSETFFTNQGAGTFTGRDLPSSSNIYVYDNDTWKKGTPYVYDNGTWKQGKPYVYDNGTWKS